MSSLLSKESRLISEIPHSAGISFSLAAGGLALESPGETATMLGDLPCSPEPLMAFFSFSLADSWLPAEALPHLPC